jgi:hypothetical protein
VTLITAHLIWSWQNVLTGRVLLPKVQSVSGLGTLVFRDVSSLSGTLKMENGTSVTIGNWIKTLHWG